MDINKIISLMPDLAVFVTVVDTGNFTEASKKLGLTPSAVSRKISRLEDALSTRLLERTTRKIAISESGKTVYDYCLQMLDSAKEAVNAGNSAASKPEGVLRIGMPKALGMQVLEPLIFPFLEKYPELKLQLKVTDRFLDPIQDDVDIIFRITDKPVEGLVSKKVGRVKLILCASPLYLKKHGVPEHPSNLVDHDCLYLGENHTDNCWKFTHAEHRLSVNIQGRYIVNHSQMRLNGIINGLGVGVLPDFTAKKALKNKSVIRVLEDWVLDGQYQGDITLQFAQSKFMPVKFRVFIDYIVEQFV